MSTSSDPARQCCICQTGKHSIPYRCDGGHELVRCGACGLIYLNKTSNPLLFFDDARKELESDSKKVEYWGFPEIHSRFPLFFESYFRERLQRCLRYKPGARSIFDIGCGYGFYMAHCRDAGLRTKGIDISREAVSYARDVLKLDAEEGSFYDHLVREYYDMYNCCDVLEHLEDPNKELHKMAEIIGPGSVAYFQVPDVIGLKIPYGHNLGLPHHLWQFNFKTLSRLLEKHGFIVLNKWYGVQGVIGAYVRNEADVFTRLTWHIARACSLGNRLMVLCKKRSKML